MEADCVTPDLGPAADGLMLTLHVTKECSSQERVFVSFIAGAFNRD